MLAISTTQWLPDSGTTPLSDAVDVAASAVAGDFLAWIAHLATDDLDDNDFDDDLDDDAEDEDEAEEDAEAEVLRC